MTLTPVLLAAALALPARAPAAQRADAPVQPDDFARLVPKDATLVARAASIEALLAPVERMRSQIAPDEEPVTVAKLFAELPVDASKIDPKGPAGFAMVLGPAGEVSTVIVKALDPQALVQSVKLPSGQYQTLVSGSFVGLMMKPASVQAYALNSEPGRVVSGLQPGLVSMRMDLQKLIETFRPMIEAGLDQFQQMIDSDMFAQEGAPFDVTDVLDLYLQFAWDLLDSAELLDVAADQRGSKADVRLGLSTLEGSPLAGWALSEKVDWRGLAGRLDSQAAFQVVSSFDSAGLFERFMPMYESMVDEASSEMGDALGGAFEAYLAHARALMPLMGRTQTISFDLGAGGVRMAALYESPDPKALLKAILDTMKEPAFARLGLKTSAPATQKQGEIEVTRWTTELDLDLLIAAVPGEDKPAPEDLAKAKSLVTALLGEGGFRVAAAQVGKGLALVGGPDEAYVSSAFARLSGLPGPVPAHLARAVEALGGSNPGMLVHYDIGRVLSIVGELAGMVGASENATFEMFAGQRLALTVSGGVEGRMMRAGLAVDLEEIASFGRHVREIGEVKAKQGRVEGDFYRIGEAVEAYQAANGGQLPASLDVLTAVDPSGESYLDEIPKDPWDRPYVYERTGDGKSYLVKTLGRDGKAGGKGEDADRSSDDSDED